MNNDGFPQLKPDAVKNASKGRVSGLSCAQGQNAPEPSSAINVTAAIRTAAAANARGDQSREAASATASAAPEYPSSTRPIDRTLRASAMIAPRATARGHDKNGARGAMVTMK